MIAGMLFARPLLVLFGASEDALVYAYPYMMIYLIGTIPVSYTHLFGFQAGGVDSHFV